MRGPKQMAPQREQNEPKMEVLLPDRAQQAVAAFEQ